MWQSKYIHDEHICQCAYNRNVAKANSFDIARFFQALGDRTRLRILNLIGDQEVCVCYFVQVLNESQPKISRHLAYLRNAGVVSTRRDGKWMHYRIATPPSDGAATVLTQALAWLADQPEMQRDRKRLESACCAPQKYVTLQGAPPPTPVRIENRA